MSSLGRRYAADSHYVVTNNMELTLIQLKIITIFQFRNLNMYGLPNPKWGSYAEDVSKRDEKVD